MEATAGPGSLAISYQGRLGALSSTIKRVSAFIKGTAGVTYTILVRAEGTGIVYTNGPVAPPLGSTEILLTDLDLSGQPISNKRFAVIFQITFTGAGQNMLVSRPFVRLE
jgi:hypothetical protein